MADTKKRYIKNYLISPFLQFKFSLYVVLLLLIYSIMISAISYFFFLDFIEILIELTEVPDTAKEFLVDELYQYTKIISVIIIGFFMLSSFIVILQTHRILGAAYAIKRHIDNHLLKGDFHTRLRLRSRDYLKDVAESLNKFTDKLRDQKNDDSKS